MFEFISKKMTDALSGLWNSKEISQTQVDEALRQVRMALLEADVNFSVVKTFIQNLREKLQTMDLGTKISGVDPTQQVIRAIHDELVKLLGGAPIASSEPDMGKLRERLKFDPAILQLQFPFTSIVVCGLQGCGKTTQVAKLAKFIRDQLPSKRILLAACDRQRPQAVEQLRQLAMQVGVDIVTEGNSATEVAQLAYDRAKASYDVLITDTAGRLYIDEALMDELKVVHAVVKPQVTLFVASATMGQDVAKAAAAFHECINITGSIVTMLDSDAKGGAVLSIYMMTKRPILFEGVGEKVNDLQLFHAESMADRLLGMGDTINLVRRMQEHVSEEQSRSFEKKVMSASFTFDDFLVQMQSMKKMGPMSSLIKMMPGAANLPFDDKKITYTEAMILAMTPKERQQKVDLTISRRKRIARGSGCKLEEVHLLVKSFEQMRSLVKNMPNLKQQMKKVLGGFSWH